MRFILLILILSSCSSIYHYNKFIDKGGKIDNTPKVVTITDTLLINGKDSIISRNIVIDCPEPVIETRWKTKFIYKTVKALEKEKTKQIKSDNTKDVKTNKTDKKAGVKTTKSDNKSENVKNRQENKCSWWLFWLGFAVCVIVMLLIKILIRYLKTFLLK